LLLSFGELLQQPDSAIRQIVNFCDIPLSDELLRLTREHSSFAFMSAHKDKFDESIVRKLSEIPRSSSCRQRDVEGAQR